MNERPCPFNQSLVLTFMFIHINAYKFNFTTLSRSSDFLLNPFELVIPRELRNIDDLKIEVR